MREIGRSFVYMRSSRTLLRDCRVVISAACQKTA